MQEQQQGRAAISVASSPVAPPAPAGKPEVGSLYVINFDGGEKLVKVISEPRGPERKVFLQVCLCTSIEKGDAKEIPSECLEVSDKYLHLGPFTQPLPREIAQRVVQRTPSAPAVKIEVHESPDCIIMAPPLQKKQAPEKASTKAPEKVPEPSKVPPKQQQAGTPSLAKALQSAPSASRRRPQRQGGSARSESPAQRERSRTPRRRGRPTRA